MRLNEFLAQMQSEVWLMEPKAHAALMARLKSIAQSNVDQSLWDKPEDEEEKKPLYKVEGGIAQIHIKGVLLKETPGWMKYWGITACNYTDIAAGVEQAAEDQAVQEIALMVNSPGGQATGLQFPTDAIFKARSKKKVNSYIDGVGASAAYRLASQAKKVYAVGKDTEIGSIGTYTVLYDYSKMFEEMGVDAKVITSGKYKATGVFGAPITDEQLKPIKQIIEDLTMLFKEDVKRGRNMSMEDVDKVATGQTWLSLQAKELGLIDEIKRFEVKKEEKKPAPYSTVRMEAKAMKTIEELQAELDAANQKAAALEAQLGETQTSVQLQEQAAQAKAYQLEAEKAKKDLKAIEEKAKTDRIEANMKVYELEGRLSAEEVRTYKEDIKNGLPENMAYAQIERLFDKGRIAVSPIGADDPASDNRINQMRAQGKSFDEAHTEVMRQDARIKMQQDAQALPFLAPKHQRAYAEKRRGGR